jgi:gliding motility-associated-like protein
MFQMKKFFLTFVLVVFTVLTSFLFAQVTVTVGTGTVTNNWCPVYSFYGYNYTQQIYTSAELTAGGALAGMQINAIRFYWAGGTGNLTNTETWTIYLANSTQNDFATTTSWLPIAQFTEVYTGAVTLPAAAGWLTINLTTPYIWNGNNIIVAVDENVSGYGSTVNWTSTSTSSTYRAIYYYNDNTNPNPASPPTATGRTYNRPNIQFDMISLTACSGTPNNGVAAISSSTGCPGVNLSLSASNITVGSGITYQWQSSTSMSGPWTNIVGGTTSTFTTSVSVQTYFQLVTTCANSGESSISNIVSYLPVGDVCGCGAYPSLWASSTLDEDISNVTVGSMSNSSNCATLAPGPGSVQNRYSNYVGFVTGPIVMHGETVNFSLTQTSCGTYNYNNGFQLYIDWNQDGDFSDANEQVYNQPVAATGNHTKTGTFLVPATALTGITRMRVVNVEVTFPTTINYGQTTTYTYGETEDYCITIVAATPCAGTPEAGSASPATQQVSIGTSAVLSLTGAVAMSGLTYQWQSGPSPSGPWTNIGGATSINYTTPALTVDTYYRCIVTCTASGENDISAVGEVDVIATVNMMNGSVTTCGSLFYDSGGASANYSTNENLTLTVYPDVPGSKVVVTFTSFNVENNYEDFYIYNGNSTTAPLLGTYTGTATIPTFTSTAADGSLTFNFTSDGSVQYAGWVASFSCYNPCVYITPTFDPVGPYCAGMPIDPLPTSSLEGRTGSWSPAINNMATTTYTFTPDPGECAYTTTMTVTINPNNPSTFNPVGPFCEGTAITPLPTTSLEGISGTWSPAINNMNTTEYTFIADGGVCAWTTLEIEIDTVPAGITNNSGSDELTCTLQNISLTATGGTAYTWTGGTPTVLASRLVTAPGTYTVTVVGANGCTTTESVDITQDIAAPTVIITNNTGTDELICSVPSINLTAAGGVSYTWSGGATLATATNTFTTPAIYYVTVTGANGCTAVEPYTISQPDTLDITELVTDAPCFGGNGVAEIVVNSGGNSPYTIEWQDGNTGFTHGSVPANITFGYTITDADLCETIGDVFVNDPDLLTVSVSGTDAKCYNFDDGTADASLISGGTLPYSLLWSNGSSNTIITDLNPGTYRVTVTDDNGCIASNSVLISEPDEIVISLVPTDANCGVAGGIINSNVEGGAGGFTYNWSNSSSLNNITGLAPGLYELTVTDANFCTATSSINIGRTGNIIANITVDHPISCAGIPDGVLVGSSVNGVLPLSFDWSNGSTSDIISSIPAGTYYLTVTDDWGCFGTTDVTLDLPNEIVLNSYVTDLKCFGSNDGKINISLSGGDPPFEILWSNASTDVNLTSLASGQYSLTVTDSRDCVITQDFTVNQPDPITFEYSKTDVTCYGLSDGSLTMNAVGGSEPYSYTVSSGIFVANTQIVTSLPAGNFSLFVRDNNNCTANGTVAIYQPAELSATVTASNPSCIGNNDGYIAVFPVGGTAPYSYTYDNMELDTTIYNRLREGNYVISVKDANGCEYDLGSVRLNEALYECLVIPSAFTPNGDGVNDKWEIRNIELYPGAYIHVFNRWGQEVYFGRPDSEPWDGKFNGKALPVGAYMYVINPNNDSAEYKGTISIIH